MSNLKKNKELFIAPLIVLFLLAVIYAFKHVFPFGDAHIGHFDSYQQYIPMYLHYYDFVHGRGSFFWDWQTGCGSDFTGTIAVYFMNPLNLFFLLFRRENYSEAMDLFLALKLVFVSGSAVYYLKKSYSLKNIEYYALSVLYSFSGYVVMYYTNISFLDAMILLPLIILSLRRIFDKGSPATYIFLLFFLLATNTYMSIFVVIFIVFYSFGYLLLCSDRKEFGRNAARLGISTFAALGLSAFSWFPVVMKWTKSTRMDVNHPTSYLDLVTTYGGSDVKLGMLLCTEIAFALIIIRLISLLKEKKKPSSSFIFSIYLMLLLVLPVFIEGIDILWHMGSYEAFPMRFGFILTFVSIDTAASELTEQPEDAILKTDKSLYKVLLGFLLSVTFICSIITLIMLVMNFHRSALFTKSFIVYEEIFVPYAIRCTLFFVLVYVLLKKNIRSIILIGMIVLQSVFAGIGFIAPEDAPDDSLPEWKAMMGRAAVDESVEIGSQLSLPEDNLSRIKLLHSALSPNYPLSMRTPSLSQWTHEVSSDYFMEMIRAGYDFHYNRSFDTGGTVFSDALFNVKQALSFTRYPVDEKLYTEIQDIGRYSVSECRYQLPVGMITGDSILNELSGDYGFVQQNELYHAVSDDSEDIIRIIDTDDNVSENELKYALPENIRDMEYIRILKPEVKGNETLYASVKLDFTNESWPEENCQGQTMPYTFCINGEVVEIPYFDDVKDEYPSEVRFGLLELGSFEDETVEIAVCNKHDVFDNLEIGALSLDKLEKLISDYSDSCVSSIQAYGTEMHITADSAGQKYLFLPVAYHSDWKVSVNGAETDVSPVLNGAFMAVALADGHNEISFRFVPHTIVTGLIISIAGVFAVLLLYMFKRKGHSVADVKAVKVTAGAAFTVLSCGMFLIMYLIPIVFFILRI